MSAGFNCKAFTFPGLKLQELLLYRDIDNIKADCELYGLIFTNGNVQFEKARFQNADQLVRLQTFDIKLIIYHLKFNL